MNLKFHLRAGALMLGLSLCGGLLTTSAHAAPADGAAKPATKAGKAGKGQRGDRRGGGPMRMMQELNLTDAQKAKLKPIMADMMTQMKAMRDDDTMDRKAKMAKMKTMREEMEKKVNAILTPEQQKKMAAMQEKMKAERRAKGGERAKDGAGKRAGKARRGGPEAPAPAL